MNKLKKNKTFQIWNCQECGDIILVESKPFRRRCSICGNELNLTDEGDNLKEFLKKSWEPSIQSIE